jgi:hypothetical protein
MALPAVATVVTGHVRWSPASVRSWYESVWETAHYPLDGELTGRRPDVAPAMTEIPDDLPERLAAEHGFRAA